MSTKFPKVTALVTQERPGVRLLLFEHPTAGIQLPAGSVEQDEPPEAAVVREVTEETGLTRLRVVSRLLVLETDLGETRRVVLRRTAQREAPTADAPALHTLRRGLPVRVLDQVGALLLVAHEEHDYSEAPPRVLRSQRGWVPQHDLGRFVERHIFHVAADDATPDSWQIEADGHTFKPFWAPLRPKPTLVAGQQEWLDAAYDALCASRRGS